MERKLTKSEIRDIQHKEFMKRFNNRIIDIEKLGYKIIKKSSLGYTHYSVELNGKGFGLGFDHDHNALLWIEDKENILTIDNPKHPNFWDQYLTK